MQSIAVSMRYYLKNIAVSFAYAIACFLVLMFEHGAGEHVSNESDLSGIVEMNGTGYWYVKV